MVYNFVAKETSTFKDSLVDTNESGYETCHYT